MNDITNKILEKIKTGEVTMVPKWQFVLQTILWILGAVVVAIIAVYLLSFILFMLHRSGILFAPLYGWHGLMLFVVASPWFLLALVGLFLLVLYLLVSHFSFSYKRPLVYSMLGVVLFVIALSSIMQQFSIHERMERFVARHEVPGLSPMYRGVGAHRPEEVTKGTIVSLTDEKITIINDSNKEVTVVLTPETKLPPAIVFEAGDEVFIFGPEEDGTIEAFGIRPAERSLKEPRRGQGYMRPAPVFE